jgi:hypothetical protein
MMPCPVCEVELDPDLERAGGVFGRFLVGEIVCLNCGRTTGVVHGEGALEAITAALERLGMQHA